MHIGYTGTCICIDPVNDLWSIVLTNREYEFASSDAVKAIYREFNNAILTLK
jgi:CubicO group peptidase (beta-lactamase class C family)